MVQTAVLPGITRAKPAAMVMRIFLQKKIPKQ